MLISNGLTGTHQAASINILTTTTTTTCSTNYPYKCNAKISDGGGDFASTFPFFVFVVCCCCSHIHSLTKESVRGHTKVLEP